MADIQWDRYPLLAADSHAHSWLTIQANLQLAQNTVEAYGRDLEDYFGFCNRRTIAPLSGYCQLKSFSDDHHSECGDKLAVGRHQPQGVGTQTRDEFQHTMKVEETFVLNT
jgi:hypothetical protein